MRVANTTNTTVYFWTKKNSTNIANSGSLLSYVGSNSDIVSYNFLVNVTNNDTCELWAVCNTGTVTLTQTSASGSMPVDTPSINVSITQLG